MNAVIDITACSTECLHRSNLTYRHVGLMLEQGSRLIMHDVGQLWLCNWLQLDYMPVIVLCTGHTILLDQCSSTWRCSQLSLLVAVWKLSLHTLTFGFTYNWRPKTHCISIAYIMSLKLHVGPTQTNKILPGSDDLSDSSWSTSTLDRTRVGNDEHARQDLRREWKH
jgi:hypothetical protein